MSGENVGKRPRLVLVPGLGVDGRLFYGQRAEFPDVIVPAWLAPERGEALGHYAERLASVVREVERGPVIVGGLSLGGMLALEMSRHLEARAVVLMASCRSPASVCGPLHWAEWLARAIPPAVVGWSLGLAPLVCGRGGGIGPADRRLLSEMVSEVSVPFLRWGARAIMEWPGAERVDAPLHHIHGDADWVIPLRCVKPTVVVRGGSHVLNLSHPGEVNRLLREVVGGGDAVCRMSDLGMRKVGKAGHRVGSGERDGD